MTSRLLGPDRPPQQGQAQQQEGLNPAPQAAAAAGAGVAVGLSPHHAHHQQQAAREGGEAAQDHRGKKCSRMMARADSRQQGCMQSKHSFYVAGASLLLAAWVMCTSLILLDLQVAEGKHASALQTPAAAADLRPALAHTFKLPSVVALFNQAHVVRPELCFAVTL